MLQSDKLETATSLFINKIMRKINTRCNSVMTYDDYKVVISKLFPLSVDSKQVKCAFEVLQAVNYRKTNKM